MLNAHAAMALSFLALLAAVLFGVKRLWEMHAGRSLAVSVVATALLLVPVLHCDKPPAQTAEPEASTPDPAAAAPTPDPTPTPTATPEDLSTDPNREAKASIAEARKHFENAKNPIDVDVFRVEYVLVLRTELEKLGLRKSSLSKLSLPELIKLARRKELLN